MFTGLDCSMLPWYHKLQYLTFDSYRTQIDAPPYRGLCLKVFLENVYGYLDI